MKQRLLLALLVLFAAAGMVKGAEDVSFTAPQNSGDISITLTGTGMYKDNITITGTGGTPGSDYTSWTTATNSKTLKLPNNSSGSSTWTISGAYTSLKISGTIVESVTVDHSELTSLDISKNQIKTLTLTSAPALETLYCQDNLLNTNNWSLISSAALLKTIDCSNNQLKGTLTVPNTVITLKCGGNQLVNVSGQASNASITFGTQSLNSNNTPTASNKWFDLKTLIGSDKVDIFSDAKEKISFGTIQKYNSTNSTSPWGSANVHRNGTTSTEYKFQSSTAYEDGTYRVQVTNSDNRYKGYTYLVTFKVAPAKFSIKLTDDVTALYGEPSTSILSGATVEAGKKIKITAKEKDGKTFSNFEQVGLKEPLAEGSDIEAMIVGPTPTDDIDKQVVSVKALYNTNTCKITLGKVAEGGSFIVVDKDNKEIANNGTVPYDSKITIIATAADKYELDQIVVNGANITSSITTDGAVSKYSIDKVQENKDINVTFKTKGGGEKTVKAIYPEALCSVSVNGNDATSSGADISGVTGNVITIKVSPKSDPIAVKSITLNNTSASSITKVEENNSYHYQAVFTVKAEDTQIDIAVTAIELASINVIPSADNDKYTYDGTAKPFAYTTNPAGLKLDVKYATSAGGTYTSTIPVNAGIYYVKYSRKADDKYAEVTEATSETVKIAKATLTLKAPTVGTKTENGVMSYTISNGSAQLNGKNITGSFKVTGQSDLLVPAANQAASHLVKLKFVPKDEIDKGNFEEATVQVPVKIGNTGVVEYTIKGTLKDGISVQIMNGDALLATWTSTNMTGIKVPKGAPIKLKFIVPSTVIIQKVLQNDASATPYTLTDNTIDLTSQTTDVNFILSTQAVTDNRKSYTIQTTSYNYEPVYDGSVKLYPTNPQATSGWSTGGMTPSSHPQLITIDNGTNPTLTYIYKQNDKVITSPVDAGTYTVEITATPGSSDTNYKETKATATMVIKKATPKILTAPTASAIGKGQVLGSSILTGGSATVTGKFTWSSPKTVVNANGAYQVTFTPDNTTNYGNAYTNLNVTITTKSILSVVEENCKITVTGSDNKTYKNGMEVPVGITLTFTVVPNNTYKLANLIVNGTALSGNTYKVTAAPISVKAELSQEFTVTVTKPDKGAIVTLPSSNKVKTGGSYNFTVACLAADKSKIVVKDGSTVITGTDGKYTISNITADKAISITLDNPTAITVAADTTLSPHKKPMGTVKITGITDDGKCYYGQTITVKATPVSGVQFAGWVGRTETTASLSIKATEPSYKFKAKYTGSPTGIETIEGIRIYGSEGSIFIGCDGDARVTIISMEGRVKKAEISGDTRIEMAAGIYGVILEKGSEVMKTKVIVR